MFTQLTRGIVSFPRSLLRPFVSTGSGCSQPCRTSSIPYHTTAMAAQPSHSKKGTQQKMGRDSSKEGLKHIRMKKKRGGKMFPNVNVSAQIIGSGTRDSPASVLVIADSTRFLFNCGEGTQRLLMDCGIKNIARLEHIFFTRMTWENLGGAIGMMITLKKIGLPLLTYYGPENLNNFVDSMRIFAQQDMMQLDVKSPDDGPFFNDVMVVKPVVINSSATEEVEEETKFRETAPATEQLSDNSDTERMDVPPRGKKRKMDPLHDMVSGMAVKRQPWNRGKKRKASVLGNICVAYICKLHDKDGKIMVDKAKSLGLQPGPSYSRLKNGESVTNEDGLVIRPEDVVGPKEVGPSLIVLECPSEEFLDSLVTNATLNRHHTGGDADSPAAVVHICPAAILGDERYRQWMNRFDESVEHIVCNSQCPSVTHLKSRRVQTKLSQLHQGIFPAPSLPQRPEHTLKNVHYAKSFERLHLKPSKRWDSENVQTDDPQMFLDEIKELPEFDSSLADLRVQLTKISKEHQLSSKYPEVVFLGTGSAMPNRERNVTAIMLHVSETQNLLMDCGEGTFNQLCHFYGDRTDEVMSNLSCVFISHRHADHHVGLLQILKYWRSLVSKDISKSLVLVAPKRVFIWLNQYNRLCEEIIHHLRFIEIGDLTDSAEERSKLEETLLNRLDLEKFETVPVRHCSHAYGLALTHKHGWKVVYSGDTMPCEALVTAGQGADLLIHEATLEDGMDEEAVIKKHSMMSEAIDIGERMEAKFIMLTHFSQRYPKMPLLPESVSGKVGIAFDFMRFSLSEVSLLPLFMPALKHLFADQIQELEDMKMKRAEKQFYKINELMSQDALESR